MGSKMFTYRWWQGLVVRYCDPGTETRNLSDRMVLLGYWSTSACGYRLNCHIPTSDSNSSKPRSSSFGIMIWLSPRTLASDFLLQFINFRTKGRVVFFNKDGLTKYSLISASTSAILLSRRCWKYGKAFQSRRFFQSILRPSPRFC